MIEEHLIKPEFLVYDNEPVTMTQTPLHYCPGVRTVLSIKL